MSKPTFKPDFNKLLEASKSEGRVRENFYKLLTDLSEVLNPKSGKNIIFFQ